MTNQEQKDSTIPELVLQMSDSIEIVVQKYNIICNETKDFRRETETVNPNYFKFDVARDIL